MSQPSILETVDFRLSAKGHSYRCRVILDGPCGKVAYSVGRDTELTDRFHKNYVVRAANDGRPLSCSCPDCYHKQSWCKHLKAIEQWWKENTAEGELAQLKLEEAAQRIGFFRGEAI